MWRLPDSQANGYADGNRKGGTTPSKEDPKAGSPESESIAQPAKSEVAQNYSGINQYPMVSKLLHQQPMIIQDTGKGTL
jgi:hypothetical protein